MNLTYLQDSIIVPSMLCCSHYTGRPELLKMRRRGVNRTARTWQFKGSSEFPGFEGETGEKLDLR